MYVLFVLFIKLYFGKCDHYKFDKYLKNHYDFGHARKIKYQRSIE